MRSRKIQTGNTVVAPQSVPSVIYGRDKEKQAIRQFVSSQDPVLHITGNPGTGKTCTVLSVLQQDEIEYTYINYCRDGTHLIKNARGLLIVDEFDKWIISRRAECLRTLSLLKRNRRQLITISNDLRTGGGLKFSPYTTAEIEDVLRARIKEENRALVDDKAIEYLSKRFERTGDMRQVDTFIRERVLVSDPGSLLRLEDVTANINSHIPELDSAHHRIVREMLKDGQNGYGEYLKVCGSYGMTGLSRQEFEMVKEWWT